MAALDHVVACFETDSTRPVPLVCSSLCFQEDFSQLKWQVGGYRLKRQWWYVQDNKFASNVESATKPWASSQQLAKGSQRKGSQGRGEAHECRATMSNGVLYQGQKRRTSMGHTERAAGTAEAACGVQVVEIAEANRHDVRRYGPELQNLRVSKPTWGHAV